MEHQTWSTNPQNIDKTVEVLDRMVDLYKKDQDVITSIAVTFDGSSCGISTLVLHLIVGIVARGDAARSFSGQRFAIITLDI